MTGSGETPGPPGRPDETPAPLAPPAPPTPEQVAERARRADKATRAAMAGVLVLEAMVVLLIPRAIAYTDSGLGGVRAGILIGLGILFVLAAATTRRSFGVAVGSVLQVAFVATGVLLGAMFAVGIIFAVIWLWLLRLRHELVGTPGGVRMLLS